jgi:hypothetical protein
MKVARAQASRPLATPERQEVNGGRDVSANKLMLVNYAGGRVPCMATRPKLCGGKVPYAALSSPLQLYQVSHHAWRA